MWIPKCCAPEVIEVDIIVKMRNVVTLFYQKLHSKIENSVQKNQYNENFILTKKCHVKDRTIIAQDTAINDGIRNAEASKELIFQYFDVTNYLFNEVEWSGARFKVLSTTKLASVTLDGKRYVATDNQPFISILIGLKKL